MTTSALTILFYAGLSLLGCALLFQALAVGAFVLSLWECWRLLRPRVAWGIAVRRGDFIVMIGRMT